MFQEKTGYINWELISKADIESLQRTGDLSLMQNYAQGLVFSQLRKEDVERIGNPTFVKLFKLSQLSIEYLLYVQDLLESTARAADMEYLQLQKQCMEIEAVAKEQRDKISKIKKKVHSKKKTIQECDSLIKGATVNRQKAIYPCRICKDKYYVSQNTLDSHYKRRHPTFTIQPEERQRSPRFYKAKTEVAPQITTEEIEAKVKDTIYRETSKLREMLDILNEKLIAAEQHDPGKNKVYEKEMQDQIQKLKNKVIELEERKAVVEPQTRKEVIEEIPKTIERKKLELTFDSFENEYKRPEQLKEHEDESITESQPKDELKATKDEQKKELKEITRDELKETIRDEPKEITRDEQEKEERREDRRRITEEEQEEVKIEQIEPEKKRILNITIEEAGSINIQAVVKPKEVEEEKVIVPKSEKVSVEVQNEEIKTKEEEPIVTYVKGTIKKAEVGKVIRVINK